jgi:hypothetical protein
MAVKPLRLPHQTAKPVNSSIKLDAAKAVKLSRTSNLTVEPQEACVQSFGAIAAKPLRPKC